MTNDQRREYYMNKNIRLYPFFMALTWDTIFVWTILTLYYQSAKGLTFSQAIMLDSVQTIAACIMCIPMSKWFANVPSVTSSRIGNLGYVGFLLILIFGPKKQFWLFAIGTVFLAFSYTMHSIKTNSILNKSLHAVDRDKDYQRVYGKGLNYYYILEALSAIISTYLYAWKPVSPFICSLAVVIISYFISIFLKNPEKFQKQNVELDHPLTYKEKQAKKPDSFIKIISSTFIITLLLYAFFFRGALSIDTTQFRLYLQKLTDSGQMPIWMFGYLFAFMRLMMGLSSKYQFKFNLKFGVRSLMIFVATFIITVLGSGLLYLFMPDSIIKMVIIIALMIVTCLLRQPNSIFLNNYMQVCTQTKNHERLYALRTIAEYLGIAIINLFYAQLLDVFNNNFAYANFIYVGVLAIPIITMLILFIKVLVKKFAAKYTIIKPEYTIDDE